VRRYDGQAAAAGLRLLLVLVAFLVVTVAIFHAAGCAHGGAVATCSERLTPALQKAASSALAVDAYEAAIAKAFANEAACLTVAAVEAAIDAVRSAARARAMSATDQPPPPITSSAEAAAIELHGEAWLAAHQRSRN
jgi:hypothetical protein